METVTFSRGLVAGLALGLVACAPHDPGSAASAECEPGTLVHTDDGNVCVFRRDQPLVIEGGFSCPASFDERIDTATSIACSARELDLLPPAVCAQIDGPCDELSEGAPARPGQPASEAALAAGEGGGRYTKGTCIKPCSDLADCTGGVEDAEELWACEDGACVFIPPGCESDADCPSPGGGIERVCRADVSGARRCVDACSEVADCGYGERIDTGQVECIDGGCKYVGCRADAQCHAPGVCGAKRNGPNECMFPCTVPSDCGAHAREELGLDGPDPNDPWTHDDAWVCRHGLCLSKVPGCDFDDDCVLWGGSPDEVCRLD